MALSPFFLCIFPLWLAPSACKDWRSDPPRARVAVLQGDTTSHVIAVDDREIVRRARAFDRANQRDSARILYEEAAAKLPEIADWLYLRAAGVTADSAGRAAYYAKVKSAAARERIKPTEAQARERAGDVRGAIAAYSMIGSRLSVLRLRTVLPPTDTARTSVRSDLLDLIRRTSDPEDARDAIALFDKLFPDRSAAEELTLARAASRAGASARAAAGYAVAAKARLMTSSDLFRYALALARLNRDADAAKQFAKVRGASSLVAAARYQRARALVAVGNVSGARTLLRSLTADSPRDTSSASALMLLADLATDENRDDDARSTLLGLVKRFPHSRQTAAAKFRAAMISYIYHDYRTAAAELDSLSRRYPESSEAPAAEYWAGKALAALGDQAAARTRWRSVASKDVLNYYAVMAARKLDTTVVPHDDALSAYPDLPTVDSTVARAATLKDVGMDIESGFEMTRLYHEAGSSPARMLATAHALAGTDQAERSIALGRKALDQLGRTPANFRLYFPVVERETLVESSRENRLDPILVASLIRQESGFNPRAVSGAGARGLMQLLPGVGQQIAASQGISPWDPALLYQPAVNIRLGTAHLSGLAHEYNDVVRILAAYNAGESRVAKWATKRGADDPEIFIERIPFVETRDYVRAILRNRAFYEALYLW